MAGRAWYKRVSTWVLIAGMTPCCGCLGLNAIVFWPGAHRANAANRAAIESTAGALEKYKAAHGRYPESLDALVPDLLPAKPVLTSGTGVTRPFDFEYAVSGSGDSFTLEFQDAPLMSMDDGEPTERWSSEAHGWSQEKDDAD